MLSPKRERFVRHYVQSGNTTQSAIEAGYSPRSAKQEGHRLLTFADVQAEIAALEATQHEADQVNREFVIAGLRELALNAKTESSRVRSYELIGKFLGMFHEQVEVHAVHDVTPLEEFSIAELRALRDLTEQTVETEGRLLS